MPPWLQTLLAVLALAVLAPAVAWLATHYGRRVRGSLIMASILLGFGHPLDPPPQDKVEAAEPGKGGTRPGEPPTISE